MATEIGKAYVQIVPSARGISGSISKELNSGMTGIGESAGALLGNGLGGKLVGMIGKLGIATAVGKVVKDSISQGMELEQNLGGTEAVFGRFASNLQKSAQTAYKNMGLSASEYMATANKMGSLFQGSGISQVKSLELTTNAMQRASDVASVMGISQEQAMESIAGAAKGNFTMMDNLGVAMNATTLKAYALEKGVNFNWNTASNAEKAELAMQMFMDRTSQYAGNFARESEETMSGAIGMLKASWSDLLANLSLGKDVSQSMSNLVTSVGSVIANLIPMVVNIVVSIPQAIIGALPSIIPTIQNCGQQIMQSLTGGVSMSMPELLQKGVDAITGFANTFLQNIPTALSAMGNVLSAILARIMQALPQILDAGITLIGNLARGLINNLPAIWGAMANVVANLMKTLYENYPSMIQSGLELIGKLVGGLIRAIPEIVGAMPQIIGAIVNAFASVDWIDLGKNIILGIVRGIAGAAGEIAKALGDVCKNALNSAKKSLGIHSPSRVFRDEVGRYIPEGMAVGISANTSDVTEAIDDMKTQAVAASRMEISSRYTSSSQRNRDDKVDAILGLLAEYLPDCAEPTVIDGNSLVDGINTQLGLAVV